MSRLRSLALNAVLLGVSLLIVVLIAEVAVRYIAPQPTGLSHQDRYGLALHYPGITRFLPQYGVEVTFNSAGMRDVEHSVVKPPGVYRILVTGDSFMEGLQVPYDSLFSARIGRALTAQAGRPVEVINASVSGWGQDDALRYLSQYGLAYSPDLVLVVMTLHNDIGDNLRRAWHTVRHDSLVAQPVRPMPWRHYATIQLKAFIATRSQLYQLWRRFRHRGEIRQITRNLNTHVIQLFRTPRPAEIADGMHLTEHLLGAIRDTAHAAGARTAVVLVPLKYQLSDTAFADLVTSAGVPGAEMVDTLPQAEVKAMGRKLAIPVIDLLPDFRSWEARGEAPVYLEWDGHWNSVGHAVAADGAVQGLAAAGVLAGLVADPDSAHRF